MHGRLAGGLQRGVMDCLHSDVKKTAADHAPNPPSFGVPPLMSTIAQACILPRAAGPCDPHPAQMPKGTDSTFAAKVQQRHGSHARFGHNTKAPGDDFTVHHYAGPVAYSCAKFLDKNRDTLSKGARAPLAQGRHLASLGFSLCAFVPLSVLSVDCASLFV